MQDLLIEATKNWTGFCILFVCLCFWTACAVACLWGIVRAGFYLYELGREWYYWTRIYYRQRGRK